MKKSLSFRAFSGIFLFAFCLGFTLINLMPTQNFVKDKSLFFQESSISAMTHVSKNEASKINEEFLIKDEKVIDFSEYEKIPAKKTDVQFLDNLKVVPGGQSLGIQLHTLGVLVVGHYVVDDGSNKVSPAEKADIQVGDIIMEINGENIEKIKDVKPIVDEISKSGENLQIKIKRDEKEFKTTLNPIKDEKNNEYQIGLYIRDSAAGIGTMTFHDPETKRYGALGHVISDMDTKKPIKIKNGSIVRSSITSIEKGDRGKPGEKQAKFSTQDEQIGTIHKNSPFGIFGKLKKPIKNDKYDKAIPIALSHEVKEGPAKILTVIEDEKIEEFSVKITNIIPQKFPDTKGMVVKVTDKKLLEKTGGIVQGMSGSPIIQNGKVIGAITHVFVNDPTSGYGIHIEWMLDESGINIYKDEYKKAS